MSAGWPRARGDNACNQLGDAPTRESAADLADDAPALEHQHRLVALAHAFFETSVAEKEDDRKAARRAAAAHSPVAGRSVAADRSSLALRPAGVVGPARRLAGTTRNLRQHTAALARPPPSSLARPPRRAG